MKELIKEMLKERIDKTLMFRVTALLSPISNPTQNTNAMFS